MGKCFISYRHTKPDEDLALFLENFLGTRGHPVFLDKQMLIGTEWVKEIEKQIRSAETFIVLLSRASILSNMVRQEVKLANDLVQKRRGKFTILPVRVDFEGKLPYDLGAYLDRIQYGKWKSGEDFSIIAGQILKAIETHGSLPETEDTADDRREAEAIHELFRVTEEDGAPLPYSDPRFLPEVEMESGTLKLDSPFYIKRKADEELAGQLGKNGQTIIIKAPRQMGKSSLLVRAQAQGKSLGYRCCYLDFQFAVQGHLESLDSLFQYLAHKLCRMFKTTIKPEECWDNYLGAKDNMTEFIRDALLVQDEAPVLLLLDEVDRLFHYAYRDDFFSVIRGWHSLRAMDETWNKLHLVISHSTDPYLWIQDLNQSPFNVGYAMHLQDFDMVQVQEANQIHGSPLHTGVELRELLDLTGGQPYLVRLALNRLVKTGCSLAQLLEGAADDRGPFGDHLRQILWRLQGNKELSLSLRQVLRTGACDHEPHFLLLRRAGLVKGDSRHQLTMRCGLYEAYLRKHL